MQVQKSGNKVQYSNNKRQYQKLQNNISSAKSIIPKQNIHPQQTTPTHQTSPTPMNTSNPTTTTNPQSYQQQLQQLYAYFDDRPPPRQQQQGPAQNQYVQNDDYLYEGCEYEAEEYVGSGGGFQEYQYQGSGGKDQLMKQFGSVSLRGDRDFCSQSQRHEYSTQQHSQPTALNRFQRKPAPQDHQLSANSSLSNQSRSLNALVSAQKHKKKIKKAPSKATSQQSISSQLSTRNKLILQNKQKKKNGDKTIQPVFFNPFKSLPFEAIDVQGFDKFYKTSHEQMFQKINELHKKCTVLGEKAFFKDKQNEQSLDEIFKLMGFKTSSKMGKGKSFRQFKAIHKYLNMDNPQASASNSRHFGDGAKMIDNAYLSQFKELMGYQETEEEKTQANKGSLFGFGFGKLERKH